MAKICWPTMAWNIPKHFFYVWQFHQDQYFSNATMPKTPFTKFLSICLALRFVYCFQYYKVLQRKCSNCLTFSIPFQIAIKLETDFSCIQIGLKENNNKWTVHLFVCLFVWVMNEETKLNRNLLMLWCATLSNSTATSHVCGFWSFSLWLFLIEISLYQISRHRQMPIIVKGF